MENSELFLKKQGSIELQKNIETLIVEDILHKMSIQFNIDIKELARKIALKKADGFSLNKNNPYIHLYIGNGSENISVELTTSENETKLKVPKSFFLE
jgi:hypothetical protein